MEERLPCTEEARGSSPLISTKQSEGESLGTAAIQRGVREERGPDERRTGTLKTEQNA